MRCQAILLVALILPLAACEADPGGSLRFFVVGDGALPSAFAQEIVLDWDGQNTWTRELACNLDGGWSDPAWSFAASDRSIASGLDVSLVVEAYEGPGTYARDRFQPSPGLTITLAEAEEGPVWSASLGLGGDCGITVEEGHTAGNFECLAVPVAIDSVESGEVVDVSGSFSCNELGRDGDGGTMRGGDRLR